MKSPTNPGRFTEHLHGYLGDVPPAEFEATFYAGANRPQELAEIK